jgi:hypothetical protein
MDQKKQVADADSELSNALAKLTALKAERTKLLSAIKVLEQFGPVPALPTVRTARYNTYYPPPPTPQNLKRGAEEMRTEAADVDAQLSVLREDLSRRQQQAIAYAKQVLQRCPSRFPAAVELESLIADTASHDGAIRAFDAAKKLEVAMKALAAAKQRAEKDIASAQANLASAAKASGDADIATAARTSSQTAQELSAKAKSNDPSDEPQISALASRLEAQQAKLNRLVREKTVLASSTGKQVHQGCLAWAKRRGMGTSSGVKVFKDEASNKAADIGVNTGTVLCRCMAVQIAGDPEITDEAKVEIARQFESRDKMNNQALAAVVAVAGGRCQLEMVDQLSGAR